MIIGGNGLRITGSLRMGDISTPSYIFDNQFNYVTALFYGDGANAAQNNTFVDSSTNAFAITRTGSTTQGSFSPYGNNWSLYTNGTSSYAYLPYSATRAIGTGDFSIECWVYIAKQPANYTRVWSHQSNYGLAGSIGIELAFGTVDTLIQTIIDGNSTAYASATYDTTGAGGSGHVRQWIHVVSSRQNGYLRLFVNGILREATANSTNINGTSNTSFGTNSQLGGDLTEMYISNFRMCIGAVPTSYSTTNTTGGTTIFTPPTTPVTTTSQGASGVQLLLFQDNRIIDRSSNNFAVTTVNNPSIQRFSPFGNGQSPYTTSAIGGSAYFNGSTDYLKTQAFNAACTGDFTFECWAYIVTYGATSAFFTIGDEAAGRYYFALTASGGQLWSNQYGGANFTWGTATSVQLNQWTHIAWVRVGTTVTGYVNGISVGTQTISGTVGNSGGITIGANPAGGYLWTGYLSNVRIVAGTAVYTANFSPPTAPLTAIANTALLPNFANAGIYDSSGMNNVVTAGSAQASTTQFKYGTASMKFNGSSDYLTMLASPNLDMGTANFTIECWVYPISVANNYPSFLSSITGWSAGANSHRFNNIGQANKFSFHLNGSAGVSAGDPYMTSTNTFSFNTWHHYAVTRSGTTWRMFVNGNLENTQTSSVTYNPSLGGLRVGWATWDAANGYFNGYVDDLRITKGYARYTSAFTPPTEALPGG